MEFKQYGGEGGEHFKPYFISKKTHQENHQKYSFTVVGFLTQQFK